MFTTRKIESKSLWLLAVCILPLCLAVPCAAASSANLAARADHLLLPSAGLTDDLPDIFIPKLPPPPPPPGLLADDLPDIFIPKLPPPPPPPGLLADDLPDIFIPKLPPPPPPPQRA
ncbi:MAG TPA: hypothetical protein VF173_14500 [Thermoanaerobaculia bacterium]|nr:hypothetical protein [Thermoanaerobaculia bacterium]